MYIKLIINAFIKIRARFFLYVFTFYIYKCVLVYNNLSVKSL